ncbi:aminopeptidase P family protein [Rhodospirillum sp. A1_3_36]|uniref:aminopeptidase P family protein n=1 Tax=Rhodospirillum sp. A1_3_36 TaxID=3391666 RepID=UPI0039A613AF
MTFEQTLIDRLAPHAVADIRDDIPAALARISVVEGAHWRPNALDLYFPGLPAGDRAALVAALETAPRATPPHNPTRLQALRDSFDALGIDAFLIPQASEHRTRDLPEYAKRLEWVTGFTGSAGTAVIERTAAWLFVDGRYVLQAAQEVDPALIESRHFQRPSTWTFLKDSLPDGTRVGYDTWLHTPQEILSIQKELTGTSLSLVPLDGNPIDRLWRDRPPRPFSAVVAHPMERAGMSSDDKRTAMAADLKTASAGKMVLTQLESIAWAFNIRAGDTAFTPVVESYAIIHDDGHADLFIEQGKLTADVARALGNKTSLHDMSAFGGVLEELGRKKDTVAIDLGRTPKWVEDHLVGAGARVVHVVDPTEVARLIKNDAELDGFREAMARDGAAMVRFMRWLSEYPLDAPLTELMIAEKVTACRAQDPTFRGLSFPPIVGSGPNGAVIHYHPRPGSDRAVNPGDVIVLDSGGQYLSGTTDITRTFGRGPVGDFERSVITGVLSCHAALASARFPQGATGSQLDGIARAKLWSMGIEYDHGTGHGIGSFLSVHEGDIRISREGRKALSPGNVLSNEPGAYLAERFGVRHENTVIVREGQPGVTGEMFLELETISAAPFQRELINVQDLSPEHLAWLDDYHAFVLRLLTPYLDGPDLTWLHDATLPLSRSA